MEEDLEWTWKGWMTDWIYSKLQFKCCTFEMTRVSCCWNCCFCGGHNNQTGGGWSSRCCCCCCCWLCCDGETEINMQAGAILTALPSRHCVVNRNVKNCLHAAWQSAFCVPPTVSATKCLLCRCCWWYAAAAATATDTSSPFRAMPMMTAFVVSEQHSLTRPSPCVRACVRMKAELSLKPNN